MLDHESTRKYIKHFMQSPISDLDTKGKCLVGVNNKTQKLEIVTELDYRAEEKFNNIEKKGCSALIADINLARFRFGKKIKSAKELIEAI